MASNNHLVYLALVVVGFNVEAEDRMVCEVRRVRNDFPGVFHSELLKVAHLVFLSQYASIPVYHVFVY